VIAILASLRTGIDRFGSGPTRPRRAVTVIPILASLQTGIDRFGSGLIGCGL